MEKRLFDFRSRTRRRRAETAADAGSKKSKFREGIAKIKRAFTPSKKAQMDAGPQNKAKRKMNVPFLLTIPFEVYKDYECMLNQTNFVNNINRFYVIQVLKYDYKYYIFNRWGRVGEIGEMTLFEFSNADSAIEDFKKKFFEKTKIKWSERDNSLAPRGHYKLIDIEVYKDYECMLNQTNVVNNINGFYVTQVLKYDYTVYKDYECMLNQTNFVNNINRFYVNQVLKYDYKYYIYNQWGRVGEIGEMTLFEFSNADSAIEDFQKKFFEKTKIKWSECDNSLAPPWPVGLEVNVNSVDQQRVTKPSLLHEATQELIEDIFYDPGIMKMPLGIISIKQIELGFESLDKIEKQLENEFIATELSILSSEFYSVIPYDCGSNTPTVIDNHDTLERMRTLLEALADTIVGKTAATDPHPLDNCYSSLKFELTFMDKYQHNFTIIENYMKQTAGPDFKTKVVSVWEVDRKLEGDPFSKQDKLENPRLLWKGIRIPQLWTILKNGNMPFSEKGLGCGIYFASESASPEGFGSFELFGDTTEDTRYMLLCEVALGNENSITKPEVFLESPNVYQSVVARGQQEPDAANDVFITFGNKKESVPQGLPIPQYAESQFKNSQYVIFKESQCRIRFLVKLNIMYNPTNDTK